MSFSDFRLSWTDELTPIRAAMPQNIVRTELTGAWNSRAAFSCVFWGFPFIVSLSVGPSFGFTFSCGTLYEFHSEKSRVGTGVVSVCSPRSRDIPKPFFFKYQT